MQMNRLLSIILSFFFLFPTLFSCKEKEKDTPELPEVNYKQEMRNFVRGISAYAKNINPGFLIIPQNGVELVTVTGDFIGEPYIAYLDAIDGIGQEDLFFGYNNDDEPTPSETCTYLMYFLDLAKDNGTAILITDYCSTHSNIDESYNKNNIKGYASFAADHRELDNIPDYPSHPYNVNTETINELSEIKNFLYLINPSSYQTKQDFIDVIKATDYDLLILDCFFNEDEFTPKEIQQLKDKANGSKRLVISYMSIGEAEDYRYYWENNWLTHPPDWLAGENPDWEGNYKVKYWNSNWQNIIYGNDNSYLKKIIDAGFDGVYLDIIDAFEYFEDE